MTNYFGAPRSVEETRLWLEKHLEYLRERREALSKEADLFWHYRATREWEYSINTKYSDLSLDQRAMIQMMNHVHLNIWLQVSTVDCKIGSKHIRILCVN